MTLSKLTGWDPIRELAEIQNRFANLMGQAPIRRQENGEEPLTSPEWVPAVDIMEDDKEYAIKAELPEVRKDDVKVSVDRGLKALAARGVAVGVRGGGGGDRAPVRVRPAGCKCKQHLHRRWQRARQGKSADAMIRYGRAARPRL